MARRTTNPQKRNRQEGYYYRCLCERVYTREDEQQVKSDQKVTILTADLVNEAFRQGHTKRSRRNI